MAAKRPSARAIALTVAVFVLGLAIGALGTYLVGHMHEGHRRQRIVDRLTHQLQLTPAQQSQVRQILANGHKRWADIMKKSEEVTRPQFDAVRTDTRNRIRAILTPAQQSKFDDFLKLLDAEREARERRNSH